MMASEISIVMMFPDRRKGHREKQRQMACRQKATGLELHFWSSWLETFEGFGKRQKVRMDFARWSVLGSSTPASKTLLLAAKWLSVQPLLCWWSAGHLAYVHSGRVLPGGLGLSFTLQHIECNWTLRFPHVQGHLYFGQGGLLAALLPLDSACSVFSSWNVFPQPFSSNGDDNDKWPLFIEHLLYVWLC